MRAQFCYIVSDGLQYSLFADDPVLIKNQLYSIGHIRLVAENALEKDLLKFQPGNLCGYKFPKLSDPRLRISERNTAIKGVPVCETCQRIMKESNPSIKKNWDVWVK